MDTTKPVIFICVKLFSGTLGNFGINHDNCEKTKQNKRNLSNTALETKKLPKL